ncbi:MAG: HAMP domain-containing histidine kinase [Planctomycetes bacterium]|nr:HAMP domain-containing histidine kinase [Planctomycetota bacterium]
MSQGEPSLDLLPGDLLPGDLLPGDLLPGVSVCRRQGVLVAVGARIKAWTGLDPDEIVLDPKLLLQRVSPSQIEAVEAAWSAGQTAPPFWLGDEQGGWRRVVELPGEKGWSLWLDSASLESGACAGQEVLRRIGQMAGGVVHEVNNPLSGVLNYVRVSRRIAEDERLEEFLSGAESEAERILEITRTLSELTPRPRSEGPYPVAPGAILRRALLLTRTQLRDAGLRYQLEEAEGQLPAIRDLQHAAILCLLGLLEDSAARAPSGTTVVLKAELRPSGVALIVNDTVDRPPLEELGPAGFEGVALSCRTACQLGGTVEIEPGQVAVVLPIWSL